MEVAAQTEEAVDRIYKAIDYSNKIKGSIVSSIRGALTTIRVATKTLVERIADGENGASSGVHDVFRQELSNLRH